MENTGPYNGFLSKIITLVLFLKLTTSQINYKEPQFKNPKKSKRKEYNSTFDIAEALKQYLETNSNNLTTNDNKNKFKKKKHHSNEIKKHTDSIFSDIELNLKNIKKDKEKSVTNFKKEINKNNKPISSNIQVEENSEKKHKNNLEITSYEKSIKEYKLNNMVIEEAMVSNVSSINLEKNVIDINNKKEIIKQEDDIEYYHKIIDNKKEIKCEKLPNEDYTKLNDEKTFLEKKTIERKIPVFIETRIINNPIEIKVNSKEKIIDIDNLRHKFIKFNTKLTKNTEDEKKTEILLFYSGTLRTVVNYISIDNKEGDIFNGKYNTIILYNDINGFTKIDMNKFKEKNKTDLNDIKINLKDIEFYTDFLLQNQHELEDSPDYIHDKFVILGEITFNLDIICATNLNILS